MCCQKSKKDTVSNVISKVMKNNRGLSIVGIRKAEGGARSRISNCFSQESGSNLYDIYRPVFWYKEQDKRAYEKQFNICHSKCYSEYGLHRTGCVGCPFGKDFEREIRVCEIYEPKLAKACKYIFKDSYEYTRQYKKFIKKKEKMPIQLSLWDVL